MTNLFKKPIDRRMFLRSFGIAAGGALVGLTALDHWAPQKSRLLAATGPARNWTLAFTDGWVSMPQDAAPIPPFFPDVNAPGDFNTYVMGIRDLSYLNGNVDSILAQKGKAQISGPLLWADVGDNINLDLWNLGFAMRPDLTDSHTVHWHGFPNQIAYFDGVPDASLSAPDGKKLSYQYIPEDAGTYMYHCHVEDVEHVHMGLTGLVFVRPNAAQQTALRAQLPAGVRTQDVKFAYNLPSTYYHREFALFISEINVHNHWNDQHFQDNDWTDYNADFSLFNGRAWPDTVAMPTNARSTDGGRLQYNPHSSIVQGAYGERVLLRIANLGFQEHSIMLPGLPLTVIGRDAKPMVAGRPAYDANERGGSTTTRADITSVTNRIDIGPGESRDVVFDVPNPTTLLPGKAYTSYPIYDREDGFTKTATGRTQDGVGALRTEAHFYRADQLDPQRFPHEIMDQ